jgi:hypothetical protein
MWPRRRYSKVQSSNSASDSPPLTLSSGIAVAVVEDVDVAVDVARADRGIDSSVYRLSWPLHLNSSFPVLLHTIACLFLKVIDTLDLFSSYINISLVLPKSSAYYTLLKVTSLCEVYSLINPTPITLDLPLLATKTGSGLSQCLSVLKSNLIPLKCLVAPESSID